MRHHIERHLKECAREGVQPSGGTPSLQKVESTPEVEWTPSPRQRRPISSLLRELREEEEWIEVLDDKFETTHVKADSKAAIALRLKEDTEGCAALDRISLTIKPIPEDMTAQQYKYFLSRQYGSFDVAPPRWKRRYEQAVESERKEAALERLHDRFALGNYRNDDIPLLERAKQLLPAYTQDRVAKLLRKEFQNDERLDVFISYLARLGITPATNDLTEYDPPMLTQVPNRHRKYSIEVHIRRWNPTTQTYKV